MQAILNCDKNWGIGKNNDLLFKLPSDMAFFRKMTSGKVVVMGSNTLLSLANQKPLKNRTNIVLWPGGDKKRAERDNFIMADNIKELFSILRTYESDNIFIIGGAMMYKTMLPYCRFVYLTKVDADGEAQVFFQNLSKLKNWKLINESKPQNDNGYKIVFTVWENSSVQELLLLKED